MSESWLRWVTAIAKTLAGVAFGYGLLFAALTLSNPPDVDAAPSMDLFLPEEGVDPWEVYTPDSPLISVPRTGNYDGYQHEIDMWKPREGGLYIKTFNLVEEELDTPLAIHVTTGMFLNGVRVNGTEIYSGATFGNWFGVSQFSPVGFPIPQELLQPGENTVISLVDGRYPVASHFTTIGEAGPIMRSVLWAEVFNSFLVASSVFIMMFVALLFLLVTWPKEDRWWTRAAVFLLVTWSVCSLLSLGIPTNLSLATAFMMDFALLFSILFAILGYLLARCGFPKWTTISAWAVGGLLSATTVIAGSIKIVYVARYGFPVESWIKFGLAPLLVAIVAYSLSRKERRLGIIEVFTVCAVAVAIFLEAWRDMTSTAMPPFDHLYNHAYYHPWLGLIFALGMCALIATQASRARQIAVDHNTILETKLREQEIQLEASFVREKELTRQETLMEERQRLMRDMHDGIGGQLVSLIVQSRSSQVQPPEISRSLVAVLDDLRLIVDSLDTAGDSLGYAIGAFRDRLGPKLREADIDLIWNVDPIAGERPIGPEKVLQMLRILQEACSNAIQHADAKTLTIDLRPDPLIPDKAILLSVTDDGNGITSEFGQRKGSRTMAMRAREIGADLKVESEAGEGTRVELRLEPNLAA